MTYRELLNERLYEAGLYKTQVESKTVDAVLTVLADESGLLDEITKNRITEADEKERKYSLASQKLTEAQKRLSEAKRDREIASEILDEARENYKLIINEAIEKSKSIEASISECETPEARDRMRLYEKYMRDFGTNEKTKGFVMAAGQILSGFVVNASEHSGE